MQGHSLRQFSDTDEYTVEELTFTQIACGEKNEKIPHHLECLPIKIIFYNFKN